MNNVELFKTLWGDTGASGQSAGWINEVHVTYG